MPGVPSDRFRLSSPIQESAAGAADGHSLQRVADDLQETSDVADAADMAVAASDVEPAAERPTDAVPIWIRRSIALFFGWVLGLVLAYSIVTRLHNILIMILAALFLSLAMEPPVNYLNHRRGWRRGTATALVMFGAVVLGLLFVGAIASVVVKELVRLVDDAPRYVHDIERFANNKLGLKIDANKVIKEIQKNRGGLSSLANDLAGRALDVTAQALSLLLEIVTVFVFAFYMTADGPKMRRSICSLLPPRRQQRFLTTWEVAIDKTGGYLYSRGIQAVVSAFATWLVLTVIGVPYPLALGLWVGVISQFIPTIGTYIAMVLPVLIALTRKPLDAIIVLAFLVLYQQFENYVLGPRVTKRTMNVHPALAIGTVFVGAAIVGPIGAVLALPATGVIQALIQATAQRYDVVDGRLTQVTESARNQRSFIISVVTKIRTRRSE